MADEEYERDDMADESSEDEDGALTQEEIDMAADLIVNGLVEDEELEYEMEYEREGGIAGFIGGILFGKKVPEPVWKVGLRSLTRLLMWVVIAAVVFLVFWFAWLKKALHGPVGSGF